jgi:hypothetical protein
MAFVKSVTASSGDGRENEDAFALGDGVAVVVDGAGLPKELRRGCHHSVRWYAEQLAACFREHLERRDSTMPQALAAAIAHVAGSHGPTCRLESGSPSATVAAWRVLSGTVEYLVLCDASILLAFHDGSVTEVTDDRMARVTQPLIDEQLRRVTGNTGVARVATPSQVRAARRAAVEQMRNRADGFWCAHSDPEAASAAIHGEVPRSTVSAIVALSDGAARGYQLLGIQTPRDLVPTADGDYLQTVIAAIREAERCDDTLGERALKTHDDATIVAMHFDL